MSTPESDNLSGRQDQAVADRLARLRSLPVDTSRLERMVQGQIPRSQGQARHRRLWLGPLRAVAAALIVVALIGALIWSTSGGPAMASPAEMVQLHRDLVSGRVPIMKVDSIEQASEALSGKWPQQPGLPQAPDSHIMACCMRSIKDRKVACVLFKNDGNPVTLSVAKSSELRSPQSPTLTRDGLRYHVESSGNLNMVSTQRDGRWICLIGQLPVDRLIEIAHGLRFQ
jgi:hypothetical protein